MPSPFEVLVPFNSFFRTTQARPTNETNLAISCFSMLLNFALDLTRVIGAGVTVIDILSNPSSETNLPKALAAIGFYTAVGYINSKFIYK